MLIMSKIGNPEADNATEKLDQLKTETSKLLKEVGVEVRHGVYHYTDERLIVTVSSAEDVTKATEAFEESDDFQVHKGGTSVTPTTFSAAEVGTGYRIALSIQKPASF